MLVTVLVDVDVGLERVTHCNAITSADATKDSELRSVLDVAGEFDDLALDLADGLGLEGIPCVDVQFDRRTAICVLEDFRLACCVACNDAVIEGVGYAISPYERVNSLAIVCLSSGFTAAVVLSQHGPGQYSPLGFQVS